MRLPASIRAVKRELIAASNAGADTFYGTAEQYAQLTDSRRANLKYALVQNLGDGPETGGETYQGDEEY